MKIVDKIKVNKKKIFIIVILLLFLISFTTILGYVLIIYYDKYPGALFSPGGFYNHNNAEFLNDKIKSCTLILLTFNKLEIARILKSLK